MGLQMGSVASNYFAVAGAAERQRLPVFLAFVFKVRQGGSRINVEEVRKGKTACTVCLSVCCPNKLARRGDVRHRHYYHFGPLSRAPESPFGVQRWLDIKRAEQCL